MHHFAKPTEQQQQDLDAAKTAAIEFARILDDLIPDGPRKRQVKQMLTALGLATNEAITHK